jgi:hypothetical protein
VVAIRTWPAFANGFGAAAFACFATSERGMARRAVACEASEGWWGKKDSNLRSHKTADLQSAPFATRDTPPLEPHRKPGRRNDGDKALDDVNTVSRWRAPGRARL